MIFPSPRDSKLIRKDFGFQGNGERKKRSLRGNLPEILTPLVTMTRKWPRPLNAQSDFEHLSADFLELGRCFSP